MFAFWTVVFKRWEHDIWWRIIKAALDQHPEQVKLSDLPGFEDPAVSRYSATTPALLSWFKHFNRAGKGRKKPYREQVRPFGFLLAFQADPLASDDGTLPRAIAAFDTDLQAAASTAFDRTTGEPVPPEKLKSYLRSLAQYHLHPEAKFLHADFTDAGRTRRRHIRLSAIDHIGKEANRWEERFYLSEDPEANIVYGRSPEEEAKLRDHVLRISDPYGVMEIAREADIAHSVVSGLRHGRVVDHITLTKILKAIPEIEAAQRERAENDGVILGVVRDRIRMSGKAAFARAAGVDRPTLQAVLEGRRPLSAHMRLLLEEELERGPEGSWTRIH